ncbi:MAG: hypothetical protein ACOC4J_04465 [Bacteroidota bacterium]
MFKMPKKIIYALPEIIGNTDLFVGRKKEFDFFLGDWYKYLEKNFPQNQAIISRRKKGKTAFLQRLFNIFWSTCLEKNNNEITTIPFYFSIKDTPVSLEEFSLNYFTKFCKCYQSFKSRDKKLLARVISFDGIKDYIEDKELLRIHHTMASYKAEKRWEAMWELACETPASIATINQEKIIQIIDEFQNINEFIYDKNENRLNQMSGIYMQVAEMREAPVIVSGSEVHWLLRIVSSLTGRFQIYSLDNLPEDEAKKAMEKYAYYTETLINEEAKEKIWRLTQGDPLYIKALFVSRFKTTKDYTEDDNIVEVYEREIEKGGEIYWTWMEYMLKTFHSVNKINSKRIMLYLFNQGKERNRDQIKKDLNLPYTDEELEEKLEALIGGDLISHGTSHFDYKITEDKTYEWVFRNMYQKEIDHFVPDITKEIKRAMGKDNYVKGKYQEFLIKEKLKKPFNLKDICEPEINQRITPKEMKEREIRKIGLKQYEIDLMIKCANNKEIWIDVKSTKNRYGKNELKRWLSIVNQAKDKHENVLFMVYSQNGFTKGTKETLIENGIYILKGV